jgi:DMSO/TMAO reductase YedYZ molybdopterin-dependent catalytic subunit
MSLTYEELRDLPSETRVATLECAGNGRVFLVPQVEGAQWELGAVGNAAWTGVPLGALLERARMEADACEIVLEGADQGTPAEKPLPPGPIAYARSLPRDKALQREVLIAYQMNGHDLPQDHGYPVRAIVPGHYGMASVKWLTRIHAVREPFRGYWQTSDYGYWDQLDGIPVRRALGEIQLKAEIARPAVGAEHGGVELVVGHLQPRGAPVVEGRERAPIQLHHVRTLRVEPGVARPQQLARRDGHEAGLVDEAEITR